jgi:uncharacterized membrane protein HdeD (DUF308 family)
MGRHLMKSTINSILAIILGLIVIIFPIMGFISVEYLIGLSILLMSIFLMLNGMSEIDYSPTRSVLNLFIGFLMLILSLGLLFNPESFEFLAAITLYLAGIFLMIAGLVTLIGNRDSKFGFWTGIVGILLGIVYIIVGTYLSNPLILGSLIGIWLIITGVFKLADK